RAGRRAQFERQLRPPPAQQAAPGPGRGEQLEALDEEWRRQPEKYRAPLVLCYLQGRSNEEAAAALACPVSTLAWRLRRRRGLLRGRLRRRGVARRAAAAAAALPPALAAAVVRGAAAFTRGAVVAGGASARAAALAEGVLMTMSLTKAKIAAAVALAVVLGLG